MVIFISFYRIFIITSMGGIRMNKIWLVLKNTKTKQTFFKYFETELEKDKFKRKIKYIKDLMIIEDSSDIYWNYS